MPGADDLQLALHVSDLAADLALSYFEAGVTATYKDDGSPVTEADPAVERLIRETLAAARPGDSLLGEELGRVGDSDRVWVIDPVDGTSSFLRGARHWRVQLALMVDGEIEIGIVTAPALGRRWWAARGQGAWESAWPRDDAPAQRLQVSATASVDGAALGALDPARMPAGAVPTSWTPLPLVELVRGEVDGFIVEKYFVWDHAPWIRIVEEAGGHFTDPAGGQAGDRGGGVYSNSALHAELLSVLGYPPRAAGS